MVKNVKTVLASFLVISTLLVAGSAYAAPAKVVEGVNPDAVETEFVDPTLRIKPYAQIAYEDAVFHGQLKTSFTYSKGNLRIYIQNKGTKSFNYSVINSYGVNIWSGSISANDARTGYFVPADGDLPSGEYTVKLNNNDGSQSPYLLSARDDL
ncbi:hypothetical protein [Paenibacillus sp. KN14-4R]|uniref:hypothetical protein n=1 Tax=Paenibacillus sp. KN14-4R TaxID=3445773 RepID=UPI003F9F101F